jgi:fatty acid CoA ligase FadD9
MILAHSRYAGQLNVPDVFTRLLFSLAVTGLAPATFYAHDAAHERPRARFEGIPVDFLAESIAAIGARDTQGFQTYNVLSPYDDGISLDTIVDWLITAGRDVERIATYREWFSRFETSLRALPAEQRRTSLLALLDPYSSPQSPLSSSMLAADRFHAAVKAVGCGVPHLSAPFIQKYITDLQSLHLL